MLLAGPPGVGKTLTAESVAETLKVPLYMMSAGDLGLDQNGIGKSNMRIRTFYLLGHPLNLTIDMIRGLVEPGAGHGGEMERGIALGRGRCFPGSEELA